MKQTRTFPRLLSVIALVLALLLPCGGCTSKEEKQMRTVIGTCAGYEVFYEELRYVTLTYKDLFASTYGEDIWDTPESAERYRAELEETVFRVMLNNYAVLAACAAYMPEDNDLNNATIQKAVDDEISEVIEAYGGRSEFEDALRELYMTESFLRFTLGVAELENELKYVLTEDLSIIEDDADDFAEWLADGNCVYVQHLFIRNDQGDDPAANLALAEKARALLQNGTDIGTLIGDATYNEDATNAAPYFFVRDVYTEVLEDAALALQKAGDVSAVAESGDGYYVFQRLEYTPEQLQAQLSTLLNSWQWAKLEDKVNEYKKDLSIVLNDYGKTVDLLAIQ